MEKTRVIFEGTEEQISNLLNLINWSNYDMPENKTHFYSLENLFSISAVQSLYECTDSQAMEILNKAAGCDSVNSAVYDAIDKEASEMGLDDDCNDDDDDDDYNYVRNC